MAPIVVVAERSTSGRVLRMHVRIGLFERVYDVGRGAGTERVGRACKTKISVQGALQRSSAKAPSGAARAEGESEAMQVSLRKKDVLSAEEFFIEKKRLRFRLTDTNGDSVNFKTYAMDFDDANYFIKTRGLYKGGTIATYRLPRSVGSLEDLYGIVGENLGRLVENIVQRDRELIKHACNEKRKRF